MQRIMIIGSGGAGKSTLARQLGTLLNLEVIHLDALHWHAGWVPTPEDEWQQIVQTLTIAKNTWIIDGNYSGTMKARLAIADTIIFLDFPRLLCLWRILKRRVQYWGRSRPDIAAGCVEKFDWEFFHWVWTFPERRRDWVLEQLRELKSEQQVVILRSPQAVQQFLDRVAQKHDQNTTEERDFD